MKLNLIAADSRISSKDYKQRVIKGEPHVLIDVRPELHYKIVSLPQSLNIPLSSLEARLSEVHESLEKEKEAKGRSDVNLYVMCRRGNDSQRAIQYLHEVGLTSAKDIVGGLESWVRDVDPGFPIY